MKAQFQLAALGQDVWDYTTIRPSLYFMLKETYFVVSFKPLMTLH